MTISCTFANAEETSVLFTDNRGNTYTVPVDWPGRFREQENDGGGVIGFLSDGGVIGAYVAPEVPPVVAVPALYAVAQLVITPGDISGIDVNSRFSAALYMDVGSYLVFFAETQPDTNYLAKGYDDAARVRISEKATDYIVVSATDANGDPTDPAEISLEIIRVG